MAQARLDFLPLPSTDVMEIILVLSQNSLL